LKKGYPRQASGYVGKCDSKKRVDLYVRCGEWKAAALVCKERNDKPALDELRKACTDALVRRELDQIYASM